MTLPHSSRGCEGPLDDRRTPKLLKVDGRRSRPGRHVRALTLLVAVVLAGCGSSNRDGGVSGDLHRLLTAHGVAASQITCVHQSGNSYLCQAMVNGQHKTVAVTDDGHAIYELGIPVP